jgi:diguanylate cyclase (GGDEF)-like protein
LLTGKGGRQHLVAGLEAGADDYLVKPCDPEELRARLAAGRRILRLQDHYLASQEALRDLAAHDPLTGLWNRAGLIDRLDRELARVRRGGSSLAVVIADLDHFKLVNDRYGHLAGDEVLRSAARRMQETLRPYDTAGRYGGEEFLLILPDCDRENAVRLAERVRQRIRGEPVDTDDAAIPLTVSLGVAVARPGVSSDATSLIAAADQALYRAKETGRDRVEVAPDPSHNGGPSTSQSHDSLRKSSGFEHNPSLS